MYSSHLLLLRITQQLINSLKGHHPLPQNPVSSLPRPKRRSTPHHWLPRMDPLLSSSPPSIWGTPPHCWMWTPRHPTGCRSWGSPRKARRDRHRHCRKGGMGCQWSRFVWGIDSPECWVDRVYWWEDRGVGLSWWVWSKGGEAKGLNFLEVSFGKVELSDELWHYTWFIIRWYLKMRLQIGDSKHDCKSNWRVDYFSRLWT